jgi:hypothetical protein
VSIKFTSKLRVVVLLAVTAALAGCGSSFKTVAGSDLPAATTKPLGYGVIDNAPLPHAKCMRAAGLPAVDIGITKIQVGRLPDGPTIIFAPDPNTAEAAQIEGKAPGAEVIGAALLFVHQAPTSELKKLEGCLDRGVAG